MTDTTRLKSTVYVGGLDQGVTAHTLAEAFVPFGEVVDISLPKPDQPNSNEAHRGFGYVEFDLPLDAKEAIYNMDGSEIYGRTIKVSHAKPQKDPSQGLGSMAPIWQQEGYLAEHAVKKDRIDADNSDSDDTKHLEHLKELGVAGPKSE